VSRSSGLWRRPAPAELPAAQRGRGAEAPAGSGLRPGPGRGGARPSAGCGHARRRHLCPGLGGEPATGEPPRSAGAGGGAAPERRGPEVIAGVLDEAVEEECEAGQALELAAAGPARCAGWTGRPFSGGCRASGPAGFSADVVFQVVRQVWAEVEGKGDEIRRRVFAGGMKRPGYDGAPWCRRRLTIFACYCTLRGSLCHR